MAIRAGNPYPYPQPHPKKEKRCRKRKEQFMVNATAHLIVAVLLLGVGAACWKCMQSLWNGMENALDFLTPENPVISITGTEPAATEKRDREAPVLLGIHNFTVYQGDTISYMSGITTTDDTDANPSITVDSSGVDLSTPGAYPVIYTATDASGNISQEQATVTVLEKQEGFVDMDTIYAAADDKLREIIRENANIKQQIQDVYAWARIYLSYGGHSDRTDWRQTAYVMLTEGKGDCYGYWAVTKLLFERLEIPNIDVRKVKNSSDDTDHFWSLVSLDGGDTWYHFDSTPRYGEGDDFCLVTDAFIDAYSASHKGSHNRDKQQYPETP